MKNYFFSLFLLFLWFSLRKQEPNSNGVFEAPVGVEIILLAHGCPEEE